jgi:hypothetical protein
MAKLLLFIVVAVCVAVVAGCGGPSVEVFVEVSANGVTHTFTLTCNPDGGTAPDPGKLCQEIAQHPEMLRPPPAIDTCIGPPGLGQAITGKPNGDTVAFAARLCDTPMELAEAVQRWLNAIPSSP